MSYYGGYWGFKYKFFWSLIQKLKAWWEEKCNPKQEPEPEPDPCDDLDNPSAGGALVEGTSGDDIIAVGDEGFTIEGGDGRDRLNGGRGDDRIDGGDGDDLGVSGNAGDDVLDGGLGNDHVLGGRGNDIVRGGEGDDELFGGSGDDTVCGGSGEDQITGDNGSDKLIGGSGSDLFVFRDQEGQDVITDFEATGDERDQIGFVNEGRYFSFGERFDTFEEVQAALSQEGDDVRLDLGSGNSVLIENVDVSDLSADNFVFGLNL